MILIKEFDVKIIQQQIDLEIWVQNLHNFTQIKEM